MTAKKRWVRTSQQVVDDSAAAAQRILTRLGTIWQTETDPDVVGYMARINTLLVAADMGGSETDALAQLDRLQTMQIQGASGKWGFGLDVWFDAHGDGTSNDPATTIYTYTTGMMALTYLDAYRVFGRAVDFERAQACVDVILDDCWGYTAEAATTGRLATYYSNNVAHDQRGDLDVVHNVNALTLAAISRIERYGGPSYAAVRPGMEKIIRETARGDVFSAFWPYYYTGANGNDQVHHEYMVEACAEAGLQHAHWSAFRAWKEWWNSDGSVKTSSGTALGSFQWGPGEMLAGFAMLPQWEAMAGRAAAHIAASVNASGVSSYEKTDEPRSITRYGLGLARFAARCTTDYDIFPDRRVVIP